jgi:hypothetical protein
MLVKGKYLMYRRFWKSSKYQTTNKKDSSASEEEEICKSDKLKPILAGTPDEPEVKQACTSNALFHW